MRILLAEDNVKLASALKSGLVAEHYAVDVVHDGTQANDLALGEEYDLVILDRMMPGMDGLTVCRELRRAGSNVPILFFTAKDAVGDRVDGLDAGADDYLVKPFAFNELVARVRSLLRRRGDKRPTLQYADIELDPASKSVKRAGQPLALTAREFSLLEYLLRHKEKVVSSAQLLDHVWSDDYDGLSNIIQTYVKQLRQKVDRAFPDRETLIQTIRGFGYKLSKKK